MISVGGIIFISLVNIIFAWMSVSSLSAEQDGIIDFIDNWKTTTIEDMYVSTDGSCHPEGENFIQREWPGTHSGCDCTYSYKYFGLYSSSCTYNQTRSGCFTVWPTSPIPLSYFHGSAICVKRSTVAFADLVFPNKPFAGESYRCGSSE